MTPEEIASLKPHEFVRMTGEAIYNMGLPKPDKCPPWEQCYEILRKYEPIREPADAQPPTSPPAG